MWTWAPVSSARRVSRATIPSSAAAGAPGSPGAVRPRRGEDVVGDGAVVVNGTRVRHARDRGEPTRRRSARARRDGLLVLVAGLAQVDVDVDEPRADDLARGVHDLRSRGRLEALSDALDLAVGDQHILHAVRGVCRVDDAAVLDEQTHGASPLLPASRSNTPIRTATPFVTWSRITEYGPSATSGESSMPRLTGPGCMINTSGRAWLASFSSVSPQ